MQQNVRLTNTTKTFANQEGGDFKTKRAEYIKQNPCKYILLAKINRELFKSTPGKKKPHAGFCFLYRGWPVKRAARIT